MNDDFLHRIRVDPPASFLAALKAKLDRQGAPPATRRVSLRTLAIVIFLGGTVAAIALMISEDIPPWGHQVSAVSNTSPHLVSTAAPAVIRSSPPESTNISVPTATDTPTSPEQKASVGIASAPIEMDWVFVPEGPFVMGATDEQKAEVFRFSPNFRKRLVNSAGPSHEVILDSFYILRNLVTNQQYDEFVEATGRSHPDEDPRFLGSKQPVVDVTWDDARAFCTWVGARLPSEAEWEKAARGTQGFVYPWGNTWDSAKLQSMDGIAHQSFANQADYLSWKAAHVANDPEAKTADVGSFPQGASPYGVLDMAGNAWEWVNDWFDPTYYQISPKINPKGPDIGEYRVLRGGAWDTPRTVNFTWIREDFMAPNSGRRVTGFRCAKASAQAEDGALHGDSHVSSPPRLEIVARSTEVDNDGNIHFSHLRFRTGDLYYLTADRVIAPSGAPISVKWKFHGNIKLHLPQGDLYADDATVHFTENQSLLILDAAQGSWVAASPTDASVGIKSVEGIEIRYNIPNNTVEIGSPTDTE